MRAFLTRVSATVALVVATVPAAKGAAAQAVPDCALSGVDSTVVPATARDVYQVIQQERDRIEPLWQAAAECAESRLLALLRWMERPRLVALANGDPFVAARVLNVQLDLARAAAVRGVTEPWALWREMQRFAASVGDGHTNVYPPSALMQEHWARPLIATDRIAGRVVVTGVAPAVAALGLRRGDLIVAVDGELVADYAEREVAPFVSASTPQDRELRTYTYDLLRGPRARPVRLQLERADGTQATVTVPRDLVGSGQPAAPVTDSILSDGTGCLRIRTFAPDSIARLARAAMRRLATTPALILDLRLNDGGSTSQAFPVLRAIADGPLALSTSWIRSSPSFWRARGFDALRQQLPSDSLTPDSTLRYTAPVVLLVGPRTFSAGEDFAAIWLGLGRGPIIGEPTGGSTGQPVQMVLPGGGRARIRTKHDIAPGGVEFDGVGIQPDPRVPRTLAGVRAGRDEVLEAARTHLHTIRAASGAPEE
jgi:carboxyl-terminal processing protease